MSKIIGHVVKAADNEFRHSRQASDLPSVSSRTGFELAIRRQFLVDRFLHRRGGKFGTSGKAAIALRFDHHLEHFKDKVLPLLVERELPWAQVINPDNVGSGNDKVGWPEVEEWALAHGGEIWNHGATHVDVESLGELEDRIVGSLHTLQANLPKLAIEGFAPIGMNHGGYNGFSPGATVEQWQTVAGQLILANHATAAGGVGGMFRPLDGRLCIGLSHGLLDRASPTTVNGYFDSLNPRFGLALLLHPNHVDKDESSIRTSTLVYLLDELVRRQNAGELEIITYSALSMANGDSSWRDNLLPVKSGRSLGAYRTTIFFSRAPHPRGSVRELVADVTMTAAGYATVTLGSVTRTFSLARGESTLRMVVTIPTDAASMVVEIVGIESSQNVELRSI